MPYPRIKALAPILGNASALAAINACNYLVPLLTVPILSRALGVRGYGELGWATALAGCATLLSDMAFNLAGTAEASRLRGDVAKLNVLYWDVTTAKALVTIITATTALAWGYHAAPSHASFTALVGAILLLLPTALNPTWLLQGIERIAMASLMGVAVRACSVPLLLVAVSTTDNVAVMAAVQSSTYAAASLLSMLVAKDILRSNKMNLDPRRAFAQARRSASLFVANVSMAAYGQSQVIVLAQVSDIANSGLFLAAERFRRAAEGGVAPLGSAVFPRLGHMATAAPDKLPRAMTLAFLAQTALAGSVAVALFLAAPLLVGTVLGPAFSDAVPTLRILCMALFLGGVNNAIGTNMMIPMGRRRAFSLAVTSGAFAGLASLIPLAAAYGAKGAALSTVTAEVTVATTMVAWLCIRRSEAWSFRHKG